MRHALQQLAVEVCPVAIIMLLGIRRESLHLLLVLPTYLQAKRAVLQLLDFFGSAADEHANDLLACLPR